MPKDITVKVYQYKELPTEQAKQKALDWYMDGMDYSFAVEPIKEGIMEDLKAVGIHADSNNLAWSAERGRDWFFCLGRGGEIEDLKLFLEYCKTVDKSIDLRKKAWQDAIKYDGVSIRISYHAGSRCENYIVSNDETEDILTRCLQTLFEKFLNTLESAWEEVTSREYMEEKIEANEYTFLEDGERFG